MVAFRFAELFFTQAALMEQTSDVVASFESRLDKILLDMGEVPAGSPSAADQA